MIGLILVLIVIALFAVPFCIWIIRSLPNFIYRFFRMWWRFVLICLFTSYDD